MQDRRRYRFRAWHHADRRLYPVISISRGGTVVKDDDMLKTCDRESIDLMQYSGLTDIDGREIYEGDIVQNGSKAEQRAVVAFESGAFCLRPEDTQAKPTNLTPETVQNLQLKIAGNIYDGQRIGPSA